MNTPAEVKNAAVVDSEVIQLLTPQERLRLNGLENDIEIGIETLSVTFRVMAEAAYHIQKERLYREFGTIEKYFKERFGFARAHAYRIAATGELIEQLSPRGDILDKLDSQAHFRPMLALKDKPKKREEVIAVLDELISLQGAQQEITPALVESATVLIDPPEPPKAQNRSVNTTTEKILNLLDETRGELPEGTSTEVHKIFQRLLDRAQGLAVHRTTGIEWTEKTWNPLQGCTHVSPGCDKCYAARDVATKLAHRYPGLAIEKPKGCYKFVGKILLLPERLADPLMLKNPTTIFVNSMSDLFHKEVPDEFISRVFDVMESATWHQFQVLTKRPERMAAFTQKRYKSKEPLPHIWLGTTAENQDWYDKRIGHLRNVVAKVRWLSCEPLLGNIELGQVSDIVDWVVCGGESKGGRKMEKAWATSLRDECAQLGIPFFFKQWGDHNEQGVKEKEKKGKGGATLDGKIHHEYPVVLRPQPPVESLGSDVACLEPIVEKTEAQTERPKTRKPRGWKETEAFYLKNEGEEGLKAYRERLHLMDRIELLGSYISSENPKGTRVLDTVNELIAFIEPPKDDF